jgi:hypothetical protein
MTNGSRPEPKSRYIHALDEKDLENGTGLCRRCGPVKLKVLRSRGKVTYKCEVAYRDQLSTSNYKRYYGDHYGMTKFQADQFVSNKVCAICLKENDLNIDHCHTTGKIRGVLCTRCNTVLGMIKDNTDLLYRAAEYLCGNLPVARSASPPFGEVVYVKNSSDKGAWPGM